MEFPRVFTKNSCGISMGLGFWLCNFHQRGVTQFCRIRRGESLFSKGKVTNLKIPLQRVFSEKYLYPLYCTTIFNKAWTQVLRRFKSFSRRVRDLWWWGSLTMVQAGNRLNTFRQSTIPQKQFTIIVIISSPILMIWKEGRECLACNVPNPATKIRLT